jgi:hypothetical protein
MTTRCPGRGGRETNNSHIHIAEPEKINEVLLKDALGANLEIGKSYKIIVVGLTKFIDLTSINNPTISLTTSDPVVFTGEKTKDEK